MVNYTFLVVSNATAHYFVDTDVPFVVVNFVSLVTSKSVFYSIVNTKRNVQHFVKMSAQALARKNVTSNVFIPNARKNALPHATVNPAKKNVRKH